MTLDQKHFANTLSSLADMLPFSKVVSAQALALAWHTFPEQAKRELTIEHWTYAAGQYLLDPERPKEMPVYLALLRYLYRLEWGQANLAWGLKVDLAARMQRPGEFHPQPTPAYLEPEVSPDAARVAPNGVLARLGGLSL